MLTALLFASTLLAAPAFAEDPAPATTPVVVPATPEVTAPVVPAPDAPAVVPATPEGTAPVVVPPADPLATPEVKVPETVGDALGDGEKAFDAFAAGKWGTGIVLLLGVLAFAYNKFLRKAPPQA